MKNTTGKSVSQENTKTRIPRQKRAIEKKEKIIHACMELVCEKGFRSTTTVDIAKRAGVSTGIVYSYFQDKKDILLSGLSDMTAKMQRPLLETIRTYNDNEDLLRNLDRLVDSFEKSHREYLKPHQEFASLSAIDPDFAKFTEQFEADTVQKCVEGLQARGTRLPHLREKVHLAYHLIETYCHEVTIYPNPEIDYTALRQEIMGCLERLFRE